MAVGLPTSAPKAPGAELSGPVAPPEDEVFTIEGLSWDQYVAINDALGDRAGLRTLFHDGSLTFVSPARVHEWSEDALDKIIFAIAVGCVIEIDAVGSTTLRRERDLAGLEGDRTYYLRDNAVRLSGPIEIDLMVDPPPDLAVEVENTSKAADAMAIYARLGVPEVWRHDVRRKSLTFWGLGDDGIYRPIAQSLGFPFLTPDDVLMQIQRAEEIRSSIRWLAQLADWVRDEIRPRLNQA